MKAILVMDMPEDCNRCYLADYVESCREYYCGPADKSLMWRVDDLPRGFKPDWCPLSPLPEKKWIDPHDVDMFDHGENHGWNACLEAITGGNHDQAQDD